MLGGLDVCASTDALLICGAGLLLDLEIGKRLTTSSTSTTSLNFVGLQGYVLYGCISTRFLYLVDRSWFLVVPIVGFFLCCKPNSGIRAGSMRRCFAQVVDI